MKALTGLAIVGVLLSGCASEQVIWDHPSTSHDQFRRDDYQCQLDAKTLYGTSEGPVTVKRRTGVGRLAYGQYAACMESKGYTLRKN